MAGGRPTKYDPAFCNEAIDFMESGYSATALAGHLKVARSTLYKWAEEHPEFSDALNVGQAVGALWWENRIRAVAEGKDGNATAAIFGLKNRASIDWRDKQELEHTGKDGGPIETRDASPRDTAKALLAALQRASEG